MFHGSDPLLLFCFSQIQYKTRSSPSPYLFGFMQLVMRQQRGLTPKKQSWGGFDSFRERVEPIVPESARDPGNTYKRKAVSERKPIPLHQIVEAIMYVPRIHCQRKV